MPGLIHGLEPDVIRRNLERVRERAGERRRDPRGDQVRARRGDGGPGRGRGDGSSARTGSRSWRKSSGAGGDAFEWDFIGNLQSRKVKSLLPRVRLIHSVASDSALSQLERHGSPETEVLVEVNVAGERDKGGIEPDALDDFIARCPVTVAGLMTMPPFTQDPEQSRPYFARLAELARERGLERLSMGTSQDWQVAVDEGATIIRLGTALYIPMTANSGVEARADRA